MTRLINVPIFSIRLAVYFEWRCVIGIPYLLPILFQEAWAIPLTASVTEIAFAARYVSLASLLGSTKVRSTDFSCRLVHYHAATSSLQEASCTSFLFADASRVAAPSSSQYLIGSGQDQLVEQTLQLSGSNFSTPATISLAWRWIYQPRLDPTYAGSDRLAPTILHPANATDGTVQAVGTVDGAVTRVPEPDVVDDGADASGVSQQGALELKPMSAGDWQVHVHIIEGACTCEEHVKYQAAV